MAAAAFVVCGLTLSGCIKAFDPDYRFGLVNPKDGWTRVAALPADNAEILASAPQSIRDDVANDKHRATWFQRGQDDYLLYVQMKPYSECGDYTREFIKVDGHWTSPALGKITICAD
jgi:hypothetical protein